MTRDELLTRLHGTGLPLMLETWRQSGRPAPEIRNDPANKTFEISFPWGLHAAGDGVDEPVNEPVDKPATEPVSEPATSMGLSNRAARILAIIKRSPGLRGPRLVELSGASRATVRRALSELEAAGLVSFRGAPKTGGYYARPAKHVEQDT